MADIKFHGLDITMNKIRSIGGGAPAYMAKVVKDAMKEDVFPQWERHTGLTDHSLQDLATLDHPYSTRFGVDTFEHPDDMVHKQDGGLTAGNEVTETESGGSVIVRLINRSAEYIYLRFGTAKMRPRDPAAGTMRDALPGIQKRFKESIKGAIINYMKK